MTKIEYPKLPVAVRPRADTFGTVSQLGVFPIYAGVTVRSKSARFWEKVDKTGDCWEWQAYRTPKGYGRFGVADGKMVLAHRFAWELVRGPVPEGLCVCHHCDNPCCVRPSHLFTGTNTDNQHDMARKGRNAQPKGEAHWKAKLTDEAVLDIRRRVEGGETQKSAAKIHGVHKTMVSLIVRRKNWKHI